MPTGTSQRAGTKKTQRRLSALLVIFALVAGIGGIVWGRSFLGESRLQQASLAELEQISRQETDNARAFYMLGHRARQAGKKQQTLDAFARAVQLSPGSEEYWLEWTSAAGEAKGPEAADVVLSEFLKNFPGSARAHLERAKLYLGAEDFEGAYRHAATAARIDPVQTDALRLMGQAALALFRFPEAEAAFTQAVRESPGDWRPQIGLGESLLEQNRNDDAVRAFREATRLAPDEPDPHLHLGSALLKSARAPTDYLAARRSLMEAIRRADRLAPEDRFNAQAAMAQSYGRVSDWAQALPWFQRAAVLAPGDAAIHYGLVRAYRALGDRPRAESAARYHQEIEKYNTEIRALSARIRASPGDAGLRLKLARLYTSHGNFVDGERMYRGMIARDIEADTARSELTALRARFAQPVPPGGRPVAGDR